MTHYELITLGEFINELKHLQDKHGIWIQDADVYTLAQADPIAKIGAGGGSYCIQLLSD